MAAIVRYNMAAGRQRQRYQSARHLLRTSSSPPPVRMMGMPARPQITPNYETQSTTSEHSADPSECPRVRACAPNGKGRPPAGLDSAEVRACNQTRATAQRTRTCHHDRVCHQRCVHARADEHLRSENRRRFVVCEASRPRAQKKAEAVRIGACVRAVCEPGRERSSGGRCAWRCRARACHGKGVCERARAHASCAASTESDKDELAPVDKREPGVRKRPEYAPCSRAHVCEDACELAVLRTTPEHHSECSLAIVSRRDGAVNVLRTAQLRGHVR